MTSSKVLIAAVGRPSLNQVLTIATPVVRVYPRPGGVQPRSVVTFDQNGAEVIG